MSLTQAVVAVVSPVLLRYRRNVADLPGDGLGLMARRVVVRLAAISRPVVTKYMSVEAGNQELLTPVLAWPLAYVSALL